MAKKKQNNAQGNRELDIEQITHKFSTYYSVENMKKIHKADMEEDAFGEDYESSENFEWYATKEIYYPIYKTKITCDVSKEQELHPVILEMLKAIKYLNTLKNADARQLLAQVTQLDSEIFASIIADLQTKGMLKEDFSMTDKGKEALQKAKERIIEEKKAYAQIDGVFNEVLQSNDADDKVWLENKPSGDAIEIQAQSNATARMENLDENFYENLTLRQALIQGLDKIIEQGSEILEITNISDSKKFYKRYVCLFYKNIGDDEKFLVINTDKESYKIDYEATELFDKLLNEQKLIPASQSIEKFEELEKSFFEFTPTTTLDFSDGKTLNMSEHKKYFEYILDNAKNEIYIQSPWIRYRILEIYKEKIEGALKRGVKVCIKYGLKPRNSFEKAGIDDEAKSYLESLQKKYNNFAFKEDNNHSKILICDDDFMILGSFNWLSFGGKDKKGQETRGETSNINKKKSEIAKHKAKFQA